MIVKKLNDESWRICFIILFQIIYYSYKLVYRALCSKDLKKLRCISSFINDKKSSCTALRVLKNSFNQQPTKKTQYENPVKIIYENPHRLKSF